LFVAALFIRVGGLKEFFRCLLMRIRRVKSRKRYLGGKKVYVCERLRVEIPSRFKRVVKPFLGQDLEMNVESRGDQVTITLRRKSS